MNTWGKEDFDNKETYTRANHSMKAVSCKVFLACLFYCWFCLIFRCY